MVEIDKKLYQDIKDYCKVNNLVIKEFVNKLLRKSFMIEKYGEKPFANLQQTVNDNPLYYEEVAEKPKYFGEMKLPNEPPYNNILVTPTEVGSEIQEVSDEYYFEKLDTKSTKVEEPKVEKKSRKRKLN